MINFRLFVIILILLVLSTIVFSNITNVRVQEIYKDYTVVRYFEDNQSKVIITKPENWGVIDPSKAGDIMVRVNG